MFKNSIKCQSQVPKSQNDAFKFLCLCSSNNPKHKHIKFTIKKAGILRTFEKMEPANVFLFDKLCQKDIKDFDWVLINP